MRDHQFAAVRVHAPADAGVGLQDRDSAADLRERRTGRFGRGLQQKFDEALKVGQSFGRIDYFLHRTGFGRRAARPRIFASK